jgi:glycosyltransferase involved in cell wall biosynthesis
VKVAVVQRRIAFFRVQFFEKLNGFDDIDLTVFHGYPIKDSYSFNTLRYRLIPVTIGPIRFNLCFSLLKALIIGNYDALVFEGALYNFPFFAYLILLKYLGKKVYWWSSGWEPCDIKKYKKTIRDYLYRIIATYADAVIVYNSKAEKYYSELLGDKSKLYVAWNVLAHNMLLDAEKHIKLHVLKKLRKQMNLYDKKVILFVGKINKQKNLALLINAYERIQIRDRINEIALIIIGDGNEKKSIEQLIRSKRLRNVYLIGPMHNLYEIAYYFKMANIFVMPGTGGLALYHAMVHALPVIVSTADGTEADLVIPGKTGFFFKPNNQQDLADKLLYVIQMDTQRLRNYGDQARQRVLKEFPMEKMVDNFRNALFS